MEEAKAYIESGILELYVLGQLNAREKSEVEAMAAKFPAIRAEISEIELALEQYAIANSIQPLKPLGISKFESNAQPVQSDAKIIPLNIAARNNTLRFAFAACLGLLVISGAALFSAYSKLGAAREQIAQLNLQRTQFARNASFFEQQNAALKMLVEMPDNPDWAKVKLNGVGKTPEARLLVYWNKKDHKVMVNNAKQVLPSHDAAHQFQLWALVDGKPVDLGVFDKAADGSAILLEMKAITGAQAFAVTLEKLGGSPTPTMEQMVVMGGV